ncbi:MAG TPA: antibiotic biosynthesis monooxygenase [Pseudonocardia sp.]|jgi:heme oxygenase (mycobilin-producing)|uniref:antibiotic biosynthesis monooxygenase family protein n=1 Tax=Pseudonocardia sp. TaxID=60912 RepID=UPI002CA4E952|nr:antibiotic biosynthesis monooxygenase [Pseudonocardia sp.]HTF49032.1 antibiotic biosynthesis monooxygenase [Pseudonocardia sp.]
MAVVKINAIEVPEGAGPELERRFANRLHAVDGQPGFISFELLRPVSGDTRYFVLTHWEDEESFQAWRTGPAIEAHAGERGRPVEGTGKGSGPVSSGSSLLEFEVVQFSQAKPAD